MTDGGGQPYLAGQDPGVSHITWPVSQRPNRKIPISIGPDRWSALASALDGEFRDPLFVVIDSSLVKDRPIVPGGISVPDNSVFLVSAGQDRTLEACVLLIEAAAERGLGEESAFVGVGGAAVCNVVGLAASLALRGLPYRLVPTSLMAQLDAAISPKVGVDAFGLKGAVGSWHPPSSVAIGTDWLSTLSERHMVSGAAEALKHAFVQDTGLVEDVIELKERGWPVGGAIRTVVERVVRLKLEVLSADRSALAPRGVRRGTHFGHAVGRVLDSCSAGSLTHGEAIAHGMVIECRYAIHLGLVSSQEGEYVETSLGRLGALPPLPGDIAPGMVLERLARGGSAIAALPTALGSGAVSSQHMHLDRLAPVLNGHLARYRST